jgi:hypothetical protein
MREPNPINRIELSEKNTTLRWIAVIALLIIGAVGITTGIMSLLNKETGWQRVQVVPQERSCSENFILQYNFSGSGAEATAVNSKLQAAYGDACVKAYQVFTPDEAISGMQNLYYVNHNPNKTIAVDPLLYAAFEKMDGTPWLYLGPAYAHYNNVILNADDAMVDDLDPEVSDEANAYVGKIAAFAGDREAVSLELLGNNQVILHVSEEYLAFAAEEEIENFIDFGYLTNAFIIDYLAETLIAEDLTEGYIVSADGYTRNLDSAHTFSFNIFDRVENLVFPAAVMDYRGPIGMVFLKDYPTANSDVNYRGREDRFLHLFVDPVDGICRTSVENLVSYSYDMDCADVALAMLPSFVGSNFSVPEGVFSVWCEEDLICCNDETVSFSQVLESEEMSYRVVLKK